MLSPSEVREHLLSAGASKVVVVSEEPECISFLLEFSGRRFVVGVYQGERALFAKIAPEHAPLTCRELLLEPRGLYVFSNSLRGLCEGIISKARVLKA